MITTTVREFSAAGPCITLGDFVKRTARGIVFTNRYTGKTSRRGGWRVERGLIHTEACRSCTDHVQTSYPNGYMD